MITRQEPAKIIVAPGDKGEKCKNADDEARRQAAANAAANPEFKRVTPFGANKSNPPTPPGGVAGNISESDVFEDNEDPALMTVRTEVVALQ